LAKGLFYALELLTIFKATELRQLIFDEKIDGVLIHSFRGIGFKFLRLISHLNLPTIFFLHDYALICFNKGMFRRGLACKLPCSECRLLSQVNAKSLNLIDSLSVIGPSEQIVDKVRLNLGLKGARYSSIPNPNSYNTSPRVRAAPKKFTIGYIGRMEPDKGIIELLDIADELHIEHDIDFIIAGAGSLVSDVVNFAENRRWVKYMGYVEPTQMVNVYDMIDIIALPSIWSENFSGVLVQALANGIPSVGFDIGGTPEIIRHGMTGLIVPVGDFAAMRNAISELIRDHVKFTAMSKASIEVADAYAPERLKKRVVSEIVRTIEFR
jgi:glycosyltransferase involved in cell wall biosynthesis